MPTIIAEMCQNHCGKRDILERMIYAAAECGADYAKMQSIHSADLTYRERFERGISEDGVVKAIERPYRVEFERLKMLDLTVEDHLWFIDTCRHAGIGAMTTVFTRGSIERLSAMAWDAIKVASYDCGSGPMLQELSRHFQTVFVSTGGSYDSEIEAAAAILKNNDLTFLHCVTYYPTPMNMLHLNRLNFLSRFSSKVGFSDHSLVARDGIKASVAALHTGASVIERHFTILDSGSTKDGPVSVGPEHLKELVRISKLDGNALGHYVSENIPEYEEMLGSERRQLTPEELLNRDYYRGRFASKGLNGETVYNWENIDVRPDF